jgi:hypothetical protein
VADLLEEPQPDEVESEEEAGAFPVGVVVLFAGMVSVVVGVALVSVECALVVAGALAILVGGDLIESAP